MTYSSAILRSLKGSATVNSGRIMAKVRSVLEPEIDVKHLGPNAAFNTIDPAKHWFEATERHEAAVSDLLGSHGISLEELTKLSPEALRRNIKWDQLSYGILRAIQDGTFVSDPITGMISAVQAIDGEMAEELVASAKSAAELHYDMKL